MLAGADRVGSGRIHHGNAAARGRWDVDRIDARPRPRDDAQTRRAREQTRGHARLTAHDERVRGRDRTVELTGFAGDVDDFNVRRA